MDEPIFDINYTLKNQVASKLIPWSTQKVQDVVYTEEKFDRPDSNDTQEDSNYSSDNILKDNQKDLRPEKTSEMFFLKFVDRTYDQCIAESKAAQRSKIWHDARRFCITASSFGSAVGHNPYCSPNNAILEKIWASFQGSENTRYGTFHEKDAQESLLGALKKTSWLSDLYEGHTSHCFLEVGLLKSFKQPWMAVSPDGLLIVNGPKGPKIYLIEFKCPASQRDSVLHPYRKYAHNVPEYYMDQLQGIMGLLNKYPELVKDALLNSECQEVFECLGPKLNDTTFSIEESLFVVWQPKQIYVTRIPFDLKYYSIDLEPKLKAWHDKFVYFSTLKYNGRLVKNSLETVMKIF